MVIFDFTFIITDIIIVIDVLINCICLILQFKVYKKWYKLVCNYCINTCQKRLTKQINSNISEQNAQFSMRRLPSGNIGFEVENGANTAVIDNNNENMTHQENPDIDADSGGVTMILNEKTKTEPTIALKTMRSVDEQAAQALDA